MVFCCVKQKRTGALCCGVIRALGHTQNRFWRYCVSRIIKHCCSHWDTGDNSRHSFFVMCLEIVCLFFFNVAFCCISVQLLSFDFTLSVFDQHIVHHLYCLPAVSVSYLPPVTSTVLQKSICPFLISFDAVHLSQWYVSKNEPTKPTRVNPVWKNNCCLSF